ELKTAGRAVFKRHPRVLGACARKYISREFWLARVPILRHGVYGQVLRSSSVEAFVTDLTIWPGGSPDWRSGIRWSSNSDRPLGRAEEGCPRNRREERDAHNHRLAKQSRRRVHHCKCWCSNLRPTRRYCRELDKVPTDWL